MNNWPETETAIDLTGINGECAEPTYRIGNLLFRLNPVGRYALYWNGKSWRESAGVTNDRVLELGVLQNA